MWSDSTIIYNGRKSYSDEKNLGSMLLIGIMEDCIDILNLMGMGDIVD
jgi:hypothetical protein